MVACADITCKSKLIIFYYASIIWYKYIGSPPTINTAMCTSKIDYFLWCYFDMQKQNHHHNIFVLRIEDKKIFRPSSMNQLIIFNIYLKYNLDKTNTDWVMVLFLYFDRARSCKCPFLCVIFTKIWWCTGVSYHFPQNTRARVCTDTHTHTHLAALIVQGRSFWFHLIQESSNFLRRGQY